MKNEIKCYKCGKPYDLNYKTVSEYISCSHCHQQMKINERTEKKFRLVRYFFTFFICLILAFLMSFFSINYFLMIFIILSGMLVFAQFADQACLFLTDKIYGLEFEIFIFK